MRKLLCVLGAHKWKGTGEKEMFFTDEGSIPYELMEKHTCECCGKEEWFEYEA